MKFSNNIFEDGRIIAINELIMQPLPVKESYKLMKLAKELKEKEDVYRGAKLAIFKKYGKEKKNKTIEISKKNQEKAMEEINELLAMEEEYSIEGKILLPAEVKLSAKQIMSLEDIIQI